jgi:hypothetical protein
LTAPGNLSEQRLDLGQARNGFQGEDVDTGLDEQLDPRPMPGTQVIHY